MKKINVYSLFIALLFAFGLHAQEVSLIIPEKTVDPGQVFSVDVKVSDFNNIASMQFAIYWNPSIIQFQAVSNLNPNMPDFTTGESNFITNSTSTGKLKTLWYWVDPVTNSAVTLADNATLFTLTFKAVGVQGSNTMLEAGADTSNVNLPFPIEFANFDGIIPFVLDNGKVTISGVNASKETITDDFILFQNSPNPFTETTYISFNLTSGTNAKLTIFDINGKLVLQQNKFFPAGTSRIPVRRDMLSSAGSYLYTLETERATATRQLIMQ